MKKILSMLALAGFISAPIVAFAAANTNGYYSTQHAKTTVGTKAAAKAAFYPYTDISIVNYSYNMIYATVPGTPVYDSIAPYGTDHIYNDNPSIYWTHLVLLDPNHRIFFEHDVCRRALVTVYGSNGSYTTNINSNAC